MIWGAVPRPRATLLVISAAIAGACTSPEPGTELPAELGRASQTLLLDPDFGSEDSPGERAEPARDYTLFEADPVRPVAVLQNSELIAVTNTVDDHLELVRATRGGVRRCGRIHVGMRPVAVAAVRDRAREAELWVVNHLSDSVSRVRVDPRTCEGEVVDTLHVGDEPRDVVVTRGAGGRQLVFVAAAHRGQHHPSAAARLGTDLLTPAGEKESAGLADVFVFDAGGSREPLRVVNLFTDKPRALAAGNGVVYAAGYQTGNRTSVVLAEVALARGLESLRSILADGAGGAQPGATDSIVDPMQAAMRDPYHLGRDYEGRGPWDRGGELELPASARGKVRIEGGVPAVSGRGRCMPDPRPELTSRFEQQVCVRVDEHNRALGIVPQRAGEVDPECQCTSGDGTLQPTTSVIVRFFDSERECGADYAHFPDGSAGCWLDAAPTGARTPADGSREQPVPMAWNDQMRFSLPDQDVFAIDTSTLDVKQAFSGVGTIIFGLAVQPGSGRVVASNTEAMNLTRFEGAGASSSTTVRGHLHESRLTLLDGRRVQPIHLNTHVDYGQCCERRPGENEQSLAFPTSVAFSSDGERLYVTALGSDKVAMLDTRALGARFDNTRARRRGQLSDVTLGESVEEPSGPVGLALDERRGRVYVKTHFSNELVVLDAGNSEIVYRIKFESPEPESIRRGRHVLYNARLTSAHGDSACASCHVFGDFDGLSWDLGDPDGETVRNPGPFALSPEIFTLTGITRDSFRADGTARPLVADFRSNKGPMATQTLRGLANHGAQHWRGDRTRRFQDEPGRHPNFGSLDEDNSFGEFDVAIAGLNGNDAPLSAELFQDFTNFALQLTLPPNPVRALDDSLTREQASARARYFGCSEVTDEQLERGQCIAPGGVLVDIDAETRACTCAQNPVVQALGELPRARALALALKSFIADEARRADLERVAGHPGSLPAEGAARLQAIVTELSASLTELEAAPVRLGARGLLDEQSSMVLARLSGAMLDLVELSRAHGAPNARLVFELLSAAAEPSGPEAAATGPGELEAAFRRAQGASELNARVLRDEAARGSGEFRNLLTDCDAGVSVACRLRVSDTLTTCHGCHTLDRDGNAEFDVYRPGFFGTSGAYSFENVSQIFKVPHLRNLYQKAGMFGAAPALLFVPESVLGARSGGFSATEHRFMGPQVRGFGFFHDGSFDTLHRFFGFTVFVARPPGTINARDTGNPAGLSAATPSADRRAACVTELRSAPESVLEGLPPALSLCLGSSPVPELCFVAPADPDCERALAALADVLGDPSFPATFRGQILPACWQLGSMLEGGGPDGACYPDGQRERAALESFMLAFDTNLKPMVGQQVTLQRPSRRSPPPLLTALLGAAARGHCDAVARRRSGGYLVVEPRPDTPGATILIDSHGRAERLEELWDDGSPITLTCYPPQARQAEARRAAFQGRQGRR